MFDMEDIKAGEKRPVRITFKATGTESLELKIRTRAEGTNVIKETTADKVDVAVKEAELDIKALGARYDSDMVQIDRYKENTEVGFDIKASKNIILDKELNNVRLRILTSENTEISSVEKFVDDQNIEITRVNEREFDIKNVSLNTAKTFETVIKTGTIGEQQTYKPINIKAEMYDESNQMIDSKYYTINVVKPIVTMEQSTNKNKTYLEEGEKIEYKYVLKNSGTAPASMKFVFNPPEGSKVLSEQGSVKKVEKELTLNPFESKEIIIQVELGGNNGVDRVSISANAEIYNEYGFKVYETNPITQIVEKNATTKRKEDLIRQGKLKVSENEMKALRNRRG